MGLASGAQMDFLATPSNPCYTDSALEMERAVPIHETAWPDDLCGGEACRPYAVILPVGYAARGAPPAATCSSTGDAGFFVFSSGVRIS